MGSKRVIEHEDNELRQAVIPLSSPHKRLIRKQFLYQFGYKGKAPDSYWTNRLGGLVRPSIEEIKFVKKSIDQKKNPPASPDSPQLIA